MGPEERGTQEIRTHFQPGFSTVKASSALYGERRLLHISPLMCLSFSYTRESIQLLLLLGLAMVVFNGQEVIQHLKNTIKKFSLSVSLGFWAGSKEGFPLRSS